MLNSHLRLAQAQIKPVEPGNIKHGTGYLAICGQGTTADETSGNRFRSPNGSGISNAKTVPVRWTEKDYNWKIVLPGPGHSSPVVKDDRLFLWGDDGVVSCLHVATGDRCLPPRVSHRVSA